MKKENISVSTNSKLATMEIMLEVSNLHNLSILLQVG